MTPNMGRSSRCMGREPVSLVRHPSAFQGPLCEEQRMNHQNDLANSSYEGLNFTIDVNKEKAKAIGGKNSNKRSQSNINPFRGEAGECLPDGHHHNASGYLL